MAIQIVLQPPGSSCCGAACVAMFAGVGLSTITATIGDGRNRHQRILRLLNKLGWRHGPGEDGPPSQMTYAIALIRNPKRSAHWVAWVNGKWYDPERGIQETLAPGWSVDRHWPLERFANALFSPDGKIVLHPL